MSNMVRNTSSLDYIFPWRQELASLSPFSTGCFNERERLITKGPIIRINPHEIHVSDPDFYDEIYTAGSRKRDKYYWVGSFLELVLQLPNWSPTRNTNSKIPQFMRSFGPGGSMVNTIDHDFHRRRRAAMGSFFSKRSIQALELSIQEKVDQLTGRFTDLAKSGKVVSLSAAYAGLTMDVISGYCFGESMGCLKKESFGQYYLDFFHDGPRYTHWRGSSRGSKLSCSAFQ